MSIMMARESLVILQQIPEIHLAHPESQILFEKGQKIVISPINSILAYYPQCSLSELGFVNTAIKHEYKSFRRLAEKLKCKNAEYTNPYATGFTNKAF